MATTYVLRAFGSVLIIPSTPTPQPETINVTWYTRDMKVAWQTRDMKETWLTRDMAAIWRTRS